MEIGKDRPFDTYKPTLFPRLEALGALVTRVVDSLPTMLPKAPIGRGDHVREANNQLTLDV